jgi:hypothetical protein
MSGIERSSQGTAGSAFLIITDNGRLILCTVAALLHLNSLGCTVRGNAPFGSFDHAAANTETPSAVDELVSYNALTNPKSPRSGRSDSSFPSAAPNMEGDGYEWFQETSHEHGDVPDDE